MQSGKGESGSQLLYRLRTRPDLQNIDRFTFGPSTSTSGQAIEIVGSEGVGKSELVLYYVAKACLPHERNRLLLNGLGTKVVFIDTELKFSVLRLAIVLEREIQKVIHTMNNASSDRCNDSNCRPTTLIPSFSDSTCERVHPNCNQNVVDLHLHENRDCINFNDSSLLTKNDSTNYPKAGQSNINEDVLIHGTDISTGCNTTSTAVKPGDIELITKESLSRIHLLRVSSASQLLSTLMSLEHLLSHDPQITLIIIDSISAFHWPDKLTHQEHTQQGSDTIMSHILKMLSKYVTEFGLTCLTTKSAHVDTKSKVCKNSMELDKICYRSQKLSSSEKSLVLSHSKHMGTLWSNVKQKKIMLSRRRDGNERNTFHACCDSWQDCRTFVFEEDGLVFVEPLA